ncbi:hypothetical protein PHMEG_0009228 [Phytophthora megakarya]|uniref:Uncharacterized protein n=1 Tax=Phytophthora megakarya TaxID=4795 RepID=A0A225WH25_9STRA|nr:hypothetical protein PHMEG_0009228 [Phytophthora megakarya]
MSAAKSAQDIPCGGCGEPMGNVHKCPVCAVSMHGFCGPVFDTEGYGPSIVCPGYQRREVVAIEKSSPVVASFALAYRQSSRAFAQAVDKFPEAFRGRLRNTDIKKTRIIGQARCHRELSARRDGGRARLNRKVISGRGRRRREWFDTLLLRQFDLRLLKISAESFTKSSIDDTGALLVDKIVTRWIRPFMEAHPNVL